MSPARIVLMVLVAIASTVSAIIRTESALEWKPDHPVRHWIITGILYIPAGFLVFILIAAAVMGL